MKYVISKDDHLFISKHKRLVIFANKETAEEFALYIGGDVVIVPDNVGELEIYNTGLQEAISALL
jgi:hypothetical protein